MSEGNWGLLGIDKIMGQYPSIEMMDISIDNNIFTFFCIPVFNDDLSGVKKRTEITAGNDNEICGGN